MAVAAPFEMPDQVCPKCGGNVIVIPSNGRAWCLKMGGCNSYWKRWPHGSKNPWKGPTS